jgi:hypothetical protein
MHVVSTVPVTKLLRTTVNEYPAMSLDAEILLRKSLWRLPPDASVPRETDGLVDTANAGRVI